MNKDIDYKELYFGLNRIINYNFIGKSFEEIGQIFFQNMPVLPVQYSTWPGGLGLYRIVDAKVAPIQSLEKSNLWYPPKEITRLGRCNLEGFPVFYASDNFVTPILESNVKVGDEIYIGKWNTTDRMPFNIDYSYMINYNGNYKHCQNLKDGLHKSFKEVEKNHPELNSEYFIFCVSMLANAFLNTNEELSAFLAHNILYGNEKVNSMAYPSVKSKREAINYAIHPKYVDTALDLEFVFHAKIINIDKFNYTLKPTEQIGRPDNLGQIIWEDGGKTEWNYCINGFKKPNI